MKTMLMIPVAGLLLAGCATGYGSGADGYYYGNQRYATFEECQAAKRSGRNTGAVVGAIGGAAAAQVAGGNLGETAAAAGAGAVAGAVIGRNTRRC